MAQYRGFNATAISGLMAILALGLGASGAAAQQGGLTLDLNKAESVGDSCQLTFVTDNGTGADLAQTDVEVAVFDDDGVVSGLVILQFGALGDGRRNVIQFDLAGSGCDGISEVLINAAPICTSPDGGAVDCAAGLSAASRTPISFGL